MSVILGSTGITFPDATTQTTAASGTTVQIRSQLFTASGTWTCPTGVTQVTALVKGSGGGSAAAGPCGASNPGGDGGLAYGVYTVVPGTAYTITIGTTGAGSAGGTANGTAGGTVSFASFCSATGGAGGVWDTNATFYGGIGTGGTLRNSVARTESYTNTNPYALGPFNGYSRASALGQTATLAFSASSAYGAGGGGGSSGVTTGIGGINGIVFLEWVG